MRLTACWLLAIGLMGTGGGFAGEPSRQVVWDEAAARHLLSRACFGGTPEQANVWPRCRSRGRERTPGPRDRRPVVPAAGLGAQRWVNTLRRYTDMPRRSTSSPSAAPVRGMTRNSRI